ncbi:addiction module antidote protein [Facilibium subflavum]|uniref:addiction module antidote protein n=1 Tax=Facilibium subflavum TaxID=2219058 RepID=UPI000E64A178|nr:addiction module antidote protein [Facilibium subflavum]
MSTRHNYVTQNTTDYHKSLIQSLHDKEEAIAYLEVALEEYENDGDNQAFMLALKNVVEAQGGIGCLSRKTGLDRAHLYRVLSSKGNPRFLTLGNILKALGFKLSISAV